MNGRLHICSLQKLDGPPSTVQDGFVIYCTVLDSTASAKNQPPWKAAKKFQQCESRNKLGTSITITAIGQDFSYDFPSHVWVILHSCHEAQKGSLPALSLASRMHLLLVPSMCSDTRGITPSSFSQVLPSNNDHHKNFTSPWIPQSLYSAFNTSSCLQLLICWVQLQSIPRRNQWAIQHTSQDVNWYVSPAYTKDYSKQEKIRIPKMSMMLGLAWRS